MLFIEFLLTNCTKGLKTQRDKDGSQTLHDACNWTYLDKPALEYHDLENVKIISYRELKAAKEIIFSHLKCIEYPEFIGIDFNILEYCVPSLMLGILDSGHAFFNVPTDPLTYINIFGSLNVKYIFTRSITSNREIICQFDIHGQSVYLTKSIDTIERKGQENINNRKYCFAYAIATSGSTGAPKIVKVPHPCILPNIMDLRKILNITSSDKITQLTNFTFDPSIVEIFLSLYCAATLFMVSKGLKNEAGRLLEEIFLARITVLQITPSFFFHQWSTERLKTTILNKDSELRILLMGGEPFPSTKLLSKASHSRNTTRVFNIYGITEVSCWSSINEIVKNVDEPCLGEPLSETIFQIRNENNEVIRGEGILYVGSTTRICIVGNETEENLNKPVFRDTGDVVSIDDQHRIFYRGRRNNIVKRFGNKVNLRELERVVMELSFVQNCATFWDIESHKLYLCLATTDTKEDFSKLRDDIMLHLKILPAIYKPDKIIKVEHFSFTTSGKICQTSLREMCRNSETEVVNVNECMLMHSHVNANKIFENLWNNHIKSSKNIGFLMSGGTSIAALQISSAIAQTFNIEFPELIGMLLKDSTCDECANYITSILISRDCDKAISHSIDISFNNDPSERILNTENCAIEPPRRNFTLSSNRKYWYKCRGKIYGKLAEEDNIKSFLKNISNVEVLAIYNLQKCIDASPTIYCYSAAELYVTVGSHSGIICTANLLETGNPPYEIKLPDRIEASVLTLSNFRGIVGCYDGYIYCIHLKTGDIIWKFQTQDMVKCTAVMCVQGSKIFVGSYDFHIYCLSTEVYDIKSDGTQIWKIKASKGGICATGCLHQQTTSVLFGTLDGSCLALEQSSGRIIWKHKLQDPIFVAPIVLRTGYVLFCSVAGTLCCFDIETDCQMWRYMIYGNVFSYPMIWTPESMDEEYVVLASHNKNIYCLKMPQRTIEEKPKLRYTLQLQSPIFATAWCEDGYMFVACTDGIFKIFDLLKGKLLATKQFPGEIFSSPVIHNNLAVLGCRDNNLYVLKLS
ncbi:beta-alanine-activating enzyme isoform X1 [Monomorium pharaonis]|uniref:beta-alanine-activating enzyme isoform X1 n=1 Tax=Monomorium pharaonis TaxID=307658 RepID=UPI00174712C1|nr:beta-alanine-activating enzyme isoform X1 [Monomorium pharaonis]